MSALSDVAWTPEGAPEGHYTRDVAWEPQKRSERRKLTMAAKSYATGFRVGDSATAQTRDRFNGKSGRVIATNLGEVGLSFTANDVIDAWFKPAELVRR